MKLPYTKVFPDMLGEIEAFSMAERGRILTMLLEYLRDGEVTPTSGNERFYFPTIKGRIDREAAEYAERHAISVENGSKGGRPRKNPTLSEKPTGFEKNPTLFGETHENPNKDKDKDKDKDKNKDKDEIDDDDSAGARDSVYGYAMDNLYHLSPTAMQELASYRADLGDDLTRYAIDEGCAHGARNWAYVRTVLEGLLQNGIKTVGEAKAAREKRTAKASTAPAQNGKVNWGKAYTQREYDDEKLKHLAMDFAELTGSK